MDVHISVWFRFVMWVAAAVALLDALSLALFPDKTASYFAWAIQNPLTPIFMAGGYLTVTIFLALTPLLTRFEWSKNRMTIAAGVVFTGVMGIATFLHLPTFFWDRFGAWLWALLYVLYPPLFAFGFWWYERVYGGEGSRGIVTVPVSRTARTAIIVAACLLGALGIALFLFPEAVGNIWPWTLTPLTAQVVAAWLLALACFAAFLGRVRNWETMRWVTIGGLGWPILLLVDCPRFEDSFKSETYAAVFYAVVLLWVAGIVVLVVYHERLGARARQGTTPHPRHVMTHDTLDRAGSPDPTVPTAPSAPSAPSVAEQRGDR